MCNGIGVLVWKENGKWRGFADGRSSHDEMEALKCKKGEEPWRFELLYPVHLVFDRAYDFKAKEKGNLGIAGEQPPREIWEKAFAAAKPFFYKHTKQQLQFANLRYAILRYADLRYAILRYADLSYADLSSADLRYADLRYADLTGAILENAKLDGIITNEFTMGIEK